jgi:hypothetical protein
VERREIRMIRKQVIGNMCIDKKRRKEEKGNNFKFRISIIVPTRQA